MAISDALDDSVYKFVQHLIETDQIPGHTSSDKIYYDALIRRLKSRGIPSTREEWIEAIEWATYSPTRKAFKVRE